MLNLLGCIFIYFFNQSNINSDLVLFINVCVMLVPYLVQMKQRENMQSFFLLCVSQKQAEVSLQQQSAIFKVFNFPSTDRSLCLKSYNQNN